MEKILTDIARNTNDAGVEGYKEIRTAFWKEVSIAVQLMYHRVDNAAGDMLR